MGMFGKSKKEISTQVIHTEGLSGVGKNASCKIKLDDDYITIDEVALSLKGFKTVKTFKVPIENVVSVEVITEENIKEKSKSVVGRGVAGAVVFGPAGLILGGLSGVGVKKKKDITRLFCISYTRSEDQKVQNLVFKMVGPDLDSYRLAKAYREKYLKVPEIGSETIL